MLAFANVGRGFLKGHTGGVSQHQVTSPTGVARVYFLPFAAFFLAGAFFFALAGMHLTSSRSGFHSTAPLGKECAFKRLFVHRRCLNRGTSAKRITIEHQSARKMFTFVRIFFGSDFGEKRSPCLDRRVKARGGIGHTGGRLIPGK